MREYRRGRDYWQDAARLQRDGWEIVSVLERPARAGPLRRFLQRLTRGRWAALFPSETERLVTYVWRTRGHRPPSGLSRRLPAQRSVTARAAAWLRRHWWLLALLLLLALLVLGVLSFLAGEPVGL